MLHLLTSALAAQTDFAAHLSTSSSDSVNALQNVTMQEIFRVSIVDYTGNMFPYCEMNSLYRYFGHKMHKYQYTPNKLISAKRISPQFNPWSFNLAIKRLKRLNAIVVPVQLELDVFSKAAAVVVPQCTGIAYMEGKE